MSNERQILQCEKDKNITRIKDVRAHCYCASLVPTQFIRHVRATSSISSARTETKPTKYIADGLCVNLVYEYFCWMLGDPHFFFRQITSFSDSFHYTKKQKILYVGSFNYFSYTIQIRPNWYMDTGVRAFKCVRYLF